MKLVVYLLVFLLASNRLLGQSGLITGNVVAAEEGTPLAGVTIAVKGTITGTQTDGNGAYKITAQKGATLIFTFIGFAAQEVVIDNRTRIDVSLQANAYTLNEVVVTAFGIKRTEREIGTSITKVNNTLINQAAPVHLANGLSGKVAGLQVNLVNNGVGAVPRLTIRGNRSFLGNNQALLVVDGVLTDISYLSSINPNDVDNISILKGPGAAALYGSDAANGVLVITTKRGTANNRAQISYTNNTQLEQISYMPDLQHTFGANGGEVSPFLDANGTRLYVPFENQSFGPAYDGSLQPLGYGVQVRNADGTVRLDTLKVPYSALDVDPRKAFFNTGVTSQHDIAYRVGDGQNYFGLGAQYVSQQGIVPNDAYNRTNFTVNGGRVVDKFTANTKVQFTYQNYNQENGDYFQGRPLYYNLLNQPAHVPLTDPRLKDITSPYGDVNGFFNAYSANPWWQVSGDNSRSINDNYTIQGSADVGYQFTKWLNATYRIGGQASTSQSKSYLAAVSFSPYALSDPWNAGSFVAGFRQVNARVFDGSSLRTRFTGDLLVTLSPTFGNLTTKLILGQQTRQEYSRSISDGASALVVPGTYNIANRLGQPSVNESATSSRLIAFFGDLTLGYRNVAFLNVTGRNDNTSLLAPGNRSFFYPSASASVILTEAVPSLKDSRVLSYLKLRGGVAQAGNISVGPYQLQNVFNPAPGFPFNSQPGFVLSTQQNDPNLKPEFTTNREIGIEVGLFDRINMEVVYYRMNTTNQTLPIQVSRTTGYTSALVNTGSMLNEGVEIDLKTIKPLLQAGAFTWHINTNFTYLNNTVTSVFGGLDKVSIGAPVYAAEGRPYPALYVTDIARVQNTDPNGAYYEASGQHAGQPVINPETGYPILDANIKYAGNTQPRYRFGLTNTLAYKGLTLNAVVEYRGGSVIYNAVGDALEFTGTGIRSAYNGRQNFVYPNSVVQNADGSFKDNTNVSTRDGNLEFWTNSGYHSAQSSYVTSAAFWKLRELALSFNVPATVLKYAPFIRTLNVAVTGRNLLMFRPKTNVFTDPEFATSSGNAQGVTSEYQTPPTRLYGFRLSVGF